MMEKVKKIPKAKDEDAAKGWCFDPTISHMVYREFCYIEEVSLETIDRIMRALKKHGFIISD